MERAVLEDLLVLFIIRASAIQCIICAVLPQQVVFNAIV